jgi:ribosomal protein S1
MGRRDLITVGGHPMTETWEELERAAREGTPVRARVAGVGETGAAVDVEGVPGHVPADELVYLAGAPPSELEGKRVPALVVAARREEDLLVLSPRALAARRLEERRERGRRAPVRVVARGSHGVLADAGGLRGWFPPDDPPRRRLPGVLAGWVTGLSSHLAYLGGSQRRTSSGDALTEVIEGVVVAADDAQARVRLLQGDGRSIAVVPRNRIAWHPVGSAASELRPGDRVRGRVVDLGLDGPVLSLRDAVPSPWPAIALELTPGLPVRLRVTLTGRTASIARLVDHPHVVTVVERTDVEPGQALTAVVGEVDVEARRLHLEQVRTVRAP